jgi:hypothetical protein
VEQSDVRGEFSEGIPKNSLTVNVFGLSLSGTSAAVTTEVDDWYLLETQIVLSSNAGIVHNDDRHRGPYLRDVTVQAVPDPHYAGVMKMDGTSPGTWQGATSHANTVEGGLSGSFGVMPSAEGVGPMATLGGSLSWSKTTTIETPDVVVDDQSTSGELLYKYTVTGGEKDESGLMQTIGPLAQVSYNNLPLDIVWVWHYPRTDQDANSGDYFRFNISVAATYWYRDVGAGGVQTHSATTKPLIFPVTVHYPSAPPTTDDGKPHSGHK